MYTLILLEKASQSEVNEALTKPGYFPWKLSNLVVAMRLKKDDIFGVFVRRKRNLMSGIYSNFGAKDDNFDTRYSLVNVWKNGNLTFKTDLFPKVTEVLKLIEGRTIKVVMARNNFHPESYITGEKDNYGNDVWDGNEVLSELL